MKDICDLKEVYDALNEFKFDLFCEDKCDFSHHEEDEHCEGHHEDCKDKCLKEKLCREEKILKDIACELLREIFCEKKMDQCECDKCKHEECINLIQVLMRILCSIEDCTCCRNNYGYLLQIDKLKCILKKLETLLCQLKCLSSKDCDLLSEALCTLFKIIDLLASILSKINNIECLCKSHSGCKCELIECMVCELEDEVNRLDKNIIDLACIVFDIASHVILNCTTCGVSECMNDNRRRHLKKIL